MKLVWLLVVGVASVAADKKEKTAARVEGRTRGAGNTGATGSQRFLPGLFGGNNLGGGLGGNPVGGFGGGSPIGGFGGGSPIGGFGGGHPTGGFGGGFPTGGFGGGHPTGGFGGGHPTGGFGGGHPTGGFGGGYPTGGFGGGHPTGGFGGVSPIGGFGGGLGGGSPVNPPSGCRYWCRTPKGQAYCCENVNEPQSFAGVVKPGQCPPVRPVCPLVKSFGPPSSCSNDGACGGVDKCCFDTCLQQHTCKAPYGFGR